MVFVTVHSRLVPVTICRLISAISFASYSAGAARPDTAPFVLRLRPSFYLPLFLCGNCLVCLFQIRILRLCEIPVRKMGKRRIDRHFS